MWALTGLLVTMAVLGGCASGGASPAEELSQEAGWMPLFEGESLEHWEFRSEAARDIWHVEDGVIDCTPRVHPRDADKHLWTKRAFGDFRLHVEWRIKDTKGGKHAMHPIRPDGSYATDESGDVITVRRRNADSGLYLRGTTQVQANIWNWPVGSGEVWRYRTNSSLPDSVRAAVTPRVRADRPIGEWNTFIITMRGNRLTVVLNDTTVIDEAGLPGVPDEGAIALQHHGGFNEKTDEWSSASSLVQFRNIYIKEL